MRAKGQRQRTVQPLSQQQRKGTDSKLSRRYQFLFVHIENGGTSVRNAPQWTASKLSGATGHSLGIKLPRHCKAITAREMLPREVYQGLFKFAFVRNP